MTKENWLQITTKEETNKSQKVFFEPSAVARFICYKIWLIIVVIWNEKHIEKSNLKNHKNKI